MSACVVSVCPVCSANFRAPVYEIKRGGGKFCSHTCSTEARKLPVVGYKSLRERARKLWIERHGCAPSCIHCGLPADIHHDDGNAANNADSNLIPLCRSHHTSLENARKPKRQKAAPNHNKNRCIPGGLAQ